MAFGEVAGLEVRAGGFDEFAETSSKSMVLPLSQLQPGNLFSGRR